MKKTNKGESMKKLMSIALLALLGFTASTNAFLFWGRNRGGACCGGYNYGYYNNDCCSNNCGSSNGCCGYGYGSGSGLGWGGGFGGGFGGFGGGYYGSGW